MRKGYNNNKSSLPFYRRNDQIRAREVRVLDHTGKQIDVMDFSKAREMAIEAGVDLVEIAPLAIPPVVKMIDYTKFLYQLKKKKQEEKKGTKPSETKQIRLTPFIGEHDLDIKLKKAKEFIGEGHKVKFGVRFPGRAITKKDLGKDVLVRIIESMAEIAKVERDMHEEGRQLVVVLSRNK